MFGKRSGALLVLVGLVHLLPANEPCTSGLAPGKRPGPYSFVLCTGERRGQAQCFICETADRPAVVVFARGPGDGLGKLVAGLDKALEQHKAAEFRAWVTFLHQDQSAMDAQVVEFGKQHGVKAVPLGVFEDADGPPSYRLSKEADVTVLLFVKQKVTANFAFRPGELSAAAVGEVLKAVPRIVEGK